VIAWSQGIAAPKFLQLVIIQYGRLVFQDGPVSQLDAIEETLQFYKPLKACALASRRLASALQLVPSTAKARTIMRGNRACVFRPNE
jgi:hypothetical protein